MVMWTASLKEYADPVMDFIDPSRRALIRMYRESCSPLKQGLAKNLVKLGKDLKDVLIIDVNEYLIRTRKCLSRFSQIMDY